MRNPACLGRLRILAQPQACRRLFKRKHFHRLVRARGCTSHLRCTEDVSRSAPIGCNGAYFPRVFLLEHATGSHGHGKLHPGLVSKPRAVCWKIDRCKLQTNPEDPGQSD